MKERIRNLRESKGLSQKNFSEILGITARSLQNYEQGEREMPSSVIKTLYEKFRVNPVWLLTGQGTMYYPVEQSPMTDEERELLDLARQAPETIPLLKKALVGRRQMAEAVESLKGEALKDC